MVSNAIILSNAPIAAVLAGNDIANGSIYGQRVDPKLDQKIFATYFIIKKIYDLNSTYSGMDTACSYLWELMGKYGIQALSYTGGGGSVAPPTGSVGAPNPYYFIVDASTSFMINGDTSKILTSFIGYNLLYVRNGITQSTISTEPTYYSWDKVTGNFITTPVVTDDLIILAAI
jgi:hypothetical protein